MRAVYEFYCFDPKKHRRDTRRAKMVSMLSYLDREAQVAKETAKRECEKLERERQRSLYSVAKERIGAKIKSLFRRRQVAG